METNEAIMAFSQSEKIKAGLIWVTQTLNLLEGLPGGEKAGGEKVINAVLNMVGNEIKLAIPSLNTATLLDMVMASL